MTVNGLIDENNRLKKELAEMRPTLRDQFAMAAIGSVISGEWPENWRGVSGNQFGEYAAYLAYAIADAMLAEREKGVKS